MKYDYNGIENTPPKLLETCWLEFSNLVDKVKSEYNIDCGDMNFGTMKLRSLTYEYDYEYIEFDFLDANGNYSGYGSRMAYVDGAFNDAPFYSFHIIYDDITYSFNHDYGFNSYRFTIEKVEDEDTFNAWDTL